MRPSAFLAARRGDGSPSLPFPLPPRDAPHRGSVLSGCSLPFWFSAQLHCTRLREFLFFKRQSDSDLPSTACCIGLVFIAAIVLGRLWRRFIGVAASAPLFVLFNILLLWGVYVFVIRRGELLEQCVQCIGRMPIVILDAIDCCGYMLFLC
ncbi:Palmitoyltransferase AKR1 [Zea mays]|uniref:Palmitoyltransferase AKR1 n=1 Tax=Zea mays TaxID=4577 RepID=A0A1D6JY35_MAIZE|nr:Palmitoyltransferase AKR1 [Zea mays]